MFRCEARLSEIWRSRLSGKPINFLTHPMNQFLISVEAALVAQIWTRQSLMTSRAKQKEKRVASCNLKSWVSGSMSKIARNKRKSCHFLQARKKFRLMMKRNIKELETQNNWHHHQRRLSNQNIDQSRNWSNRSNRSKAGIRNIDSNQKSSSRARCSQQQP